MGNNMKQDWKQRRENVFFFANNERGVHQVSTNKTPSIVRIAHTLQRRCSYCTQIAPRIEWKTFSPCSVVLDECVDNATSAEEWKWCAPSLMAILGPDQVPSIFLSIRDDHRTKHEQFMRQPRVDYYHDTDWKEKREWIPNNVFLLCVTHIFMCHSEHSSLQVQY